MKFRRSAKIFTGQLDIAAFACLFFLLVIFMMLRSSMIVPSGMALQLPEGDRRSFPGLVRPTLVVAIDHRGQIYFENQILNPPELTVKLKRHVAQSKETLTLVIQADKDVNYAALLTVAQAARRAGISQAILATRPHVARPIPAPPKHE